MGEGAAPAVYKNFVALGVKRGNATIPQIVLLGLLAGWYIGFGMLLVLTCGMDTPTIGKDNLGLTKMLSGLYGLPFGLYMVVVMGADLCTSNFASVPLAVFEGKITWKQALKSLTLTWAFNFIGSVFLAWIVAQSGSVLHPAVIDKVTLTKVSLPFHKAVAKGVLCNWLVCTAVAMAGSTDNVAAKFLCILAPISIFVSESFEHVVANMFALPFGIMVGAQYSVSEMFVGNILPVTLGNILGAVGPVGLMMWLAYGSRNGAPLPTWASENTIAKKELANGNGARPDELAVTVHEY